MSRNMMAVASSALFVLLAAGLILIPVPFVTWRPGQAVDMMGSTDEGPLIEISGIPTGNSGDKLLMTTVSTTRVDSGISLSEAPLACVATDSNTLPREVVHPAGKPNAEVQNEAVAMMDSSRVNAIVAALRATGQAITEMPMMSSVSLSGPANGQLRPGDPIEAVDGNEVTVNKKVKTTIQIGAVGNPIVFRVIRDGNNGNVTVTTVAERDGTLYLGISFLIGYRYAPSVSYRIDSSTVSPPAGLVFTLAIYDRIADRVLYEKRVVAGTGQVDAAGRVYGIGGIRGKIRGAGATGAKLFLMPASNCTGLGDLRTGLRLVPVGTLKDAIAVLQLISEGQSTQEMPSYG